METPSTSLPEAIGEALLTPFAAFLKTVVESVETPSTGLPEAIGEALQASCAATPETTRQSDLTLFSSLVLSNPKHPDNYSISGLAEFEAQHAAGNPAPAEIVREVDADLPLTSVPNSTVHSLPVHGSTLDTAPTPQVQPSCSFFAGCLGGTHALVFVQ